jgi:general secretion pathway protein N
LRVRRGWVIGGVVVLSVAAVIWWLPARWVVPLIESRLHGMQLQLVQGQLWDGRAGQLVATDGRSLGVLHWRLSRRLLLGEVQLRVDLDNPTLHFGGDLRQVAGSRQEWRNVAVRIDLGGQPPVLTPFGSPGGVLEVTVPYVLLQSNWPLQLEAWAQWHDAVVGTGDGQVALGDLRFMAQGDEGMIRAQAHDRGNGPLALDGRVELSPIGWHLDARLHPRNDDPALRRWLATLGRADADGAVHLERRGGLVTALPDHGAKR